MKINPAASGQLTPLAHLLAVLNDPATDPERRDRVAALALPYLHARLAPKSSTKKAEREAAALEPAPEDSPWHGLLDYERAATAPMRPAPVPRPVPAVTVAKTWDELLEPGADRGEAIKAVERVWDGLPA